MKLTENEAKVLGALYAGQPLSAQELHVRTGLTPIAVRAAAAVLTHDGWVSRNDRIPTYWRITDNGRRLAETRTYREYRPADA